MCAAVAMSLIAVSPLAAQDDEAFAERERELARQLAEQQESSARRERELARELESQQRERQAQQREFEVQHREQQARQAEQQRQMAQELQARQRDFQAQQRELAAQQETSARELARELAKAREELQVSAAEIARLSAELSSSAVKGAAGYVRDAQRFVLGSGAVLGINVADADGGVRVNGVSPNGPAADAGVRVGDTIVAIDGMELDRGDGTAVLLARMDDVDPGDEVELRIRRGNDARAIVVEAGDSGPRRFWLAPRPGTASAAPSAPAAPAPVRAGRGDYVFAFGRPWGDVELVALTPGLGEYFGTEQGLLVVRAGSMAELGLRDGDVMLEIGGREPQSPEHATRILASFEPGESVPLSIMRQRRPETVTITVPEEPWTGLNLFRSDPF